tara:strand:+ start:984 stop:1196 length:213 start_codon:yes stop_codon:yes gene_type:complete
MSCRYNRLKLKILIKYIWLEKITEELNEEEIKEVEERKENQEEGGVEVEEENKEEDVVVAEEKIWVNIIH